MAAFLDLCRFIASAGGTTDWTYSSTVSPYISPTDAGAVNGRIYKVRAESADLTQWEVSEGAYSSAGVGSFARATVLYNSAGTGTKQSGAGTKINFTSAPQVWVVASKFDLLSIEEDNAFADAQQAQARKNLYAAPFDALMFSGLQVNGGMEISQQNPSALGNLGTGNAYYPADQFQVTTIGSQVIGAQQVSDAPAGYTKSLKITVSAANASPSSGDSAVIRMKIEGQRSGRLAWGSSAAQPLVLGFWVKVNRTGLYSGVIRNSAADRRWPFSFAVNTSNTWEFKTIGITGDTTGTWLTDTGVGLDIFFAVMAGSGGLGTAGAWISPGSGIIGVTGTTNGVAAMSDTFQLTGLIVLPGIELPAAARTALIMRPFDHELLLCQRYYEKSFDQGTIVAQNTGVVNGAVNFGQIAGASTSQSLTSFRFAARKRIAPTMTSYNYAAANAQIRNVATGTDWTSTAFGGVGEGGFGLSGTSPGGSGVGQTNYVHWSADARL